MTLAGLSKATLVCIASCWMISCGETAPPSYVLGATKEIVSDISDGVYWLDNSTVVFVGEDERATQGGFDLSRAKIYIWRLGQVPRTYATDRWPLANGVEQSYVCAAKGRIRYSAGPVEFQKFRATTRRDGSPLPSTAYPFINLSSQQEVFEGPPGAEVRRRRVLLSYTKLGDIRYPLNQSPVNLRIGHRDCDDYIDDRMIGRVWVRSYNKQYYLDFGDQEAPIHDGFKSIILREARSDKIREFRSDGFRVGVSCVDSPSWEQSFILSDCDHGWDDGSRSLKYMTIYRIDPARHAIQAIKIENSPALWGAHVVRYKHGYFAASTASPSGDAERYEGLYVVSSGKLSKIYSGSYRNPSMSPDGCRVAVLALRRSANKYRPIANLVVVDLCKAMEIDATPRR
jgi:hypothetical protein